MRRFLSLIFRALTWSLALTIILAIAAALGVGLMTLRAGSDRGEAQPLPVSVTEIVYTDRYRTTRFFPGRIDAAQVADIGFQVGGEITEMIADVGDDIDKGEVIARLDRTRFANRLDELIASRAEVNASLARAQATIARIEGLAEDGYATQQSLDDTTAERDGLQARIRQLDEAIATARKDLQDTDLVAPYAGVITQLYADTGATVNSGQPVARLNASGKLEALVGVPATFAGKLAVGDVQTLRANGLEAEGRVTGKSSSVDEATRTMTVRLEIDRDPGFVPGSLVRLAMEEERYGRGAWVPTTALVESYQGLWSVYVVERDEAGSRVVRKDVEIIHAAGERVYVTGTLEDGDQVVTAAPFRFVPGQRVTVKQQAIASAETGAGL